MIRETSVPTIRISEFWAGKMPTTRVHWMYLTRRLPFEPESYHSSHEPGGPLGRTARRTPAAAEVLNRFYWNVTVEHWEDEVLLRGGEILIARFPSIGELQVFTAGMALSLSVLPESAIRALDQEVGE